MQSTLIATANSTQLIHRRYRPESILSECNGVSLCQNIKMWHHIITVIGRPYHVKSNFIDYFMALSFCRSGLTKMQTQIQ